MRRRIPEHDESAIKALRRRGWSIRSIAEATGYGPGAVRYRLRSDAADRESESAFRRASRAERRKAWLVAWASTVIASATEDDFLIALEHPSATLEEREHIRAEMEARFK